MLKPLTIGQKTFESNLIQAPLAGVSCAPFRELVWQFGGVAYCCTEMLSAQHIANGTDRSPRYQTRFLSEKNLCWQLSGNNPDMLARAADQAINCGANILDLNCGCPQPKIRKKGCGSQLLQDEKKLSHLVRAIKHDDKIPVTVKMRVSKNPDAFCDVSVAKILQDAGADAIIVHGRHWSEDYETACSVDAIARIVSAVEIPVIGNGDIDSAAQLAHVFSQTQCAGFMIARASVGQPWLFQQIMCELENKPFQIPAQSIIGKLFTQHVRGLMQIDGERNAIFQSRQLGKYYARRMVNKVEFLNKLYQADNFLLFEALVCRYFTDEANF